jgi:hypothetical protein
MSALLTAKEVTGYSQHSSDDGGSIFPHTVRLDDLKMSELAPNLTYGQNSFLKAQLVQNFACVWNPKFYYSIHNSLKFDPTPVRGIHVPHPHS